jgi:flagellar protein FlbD
MITLHRLGHATEKLHLNHDMIVTVEANPDTVITLKTGAKIVVAETTDQVVRGVRDCRVEILTEAMRLRRELRATPAAPIAQEPGVPRLHAVEPANPDDQDRASGR